MPRLAARLALLALLFVGCVSPEDPPTNCDRACAAENACAGAKQYNCASLCDAIPEGCEEEHRAYWDCAFAHVDQACKSYLGPCGSEFTKWGLCIAFWCMVHPLDANCYYRK